MSKKRIKIPKKVEDEVLEKSEGKCFCGKRGDNIHHLDENPANNDFDNLIFLCYDHHHEASVKNGLKKKMSVTQLKKLREKLYKQNDNKRQIELKHYGTTLKKITDENLFKAALESSIVMEIIQVSEEYTLEGNWGKRSEILWKLHKYCDYRTLRVSEEFFRHLESITDYPRAGMPADLADTILNLIIEFFPHSDSSREKKRVLEVSNTIGHIAFAIVYDAFIHLGNLALAGSGLNILKYLYEKGKRAGIKEIQSVTLKKYLELEATLQRPERNDLENATRLLKIYKEDLDNHGLTIPAEVPDDLFNLMMGHRKESRQG